jgi:hypothetical protein
MLGKGNRQVLPVHTMNTYRSRIIPHSFLTSAADGGDWLTPRRGRFTPGKEPRYPLNRRLGGPHSRSERFVEKKNLLPLP